MGTQEVRDIKNPTRHERVYNSTSGALMDRVCVSPMGSSLALSGERDEFVWETETETALQGHKSQNKREPLLQKWSGAAQEGRIIKIPAKHDIVYNSTSGAKTGRVNVSP